MPDTKLTKRELGIALYTIEMDGCLNGVYTDKDAKGKIFNEINRKKNKPKSIIGDYDSHYFDIENKYCSGSLKITKQGVTYSFKWKSIKGKPEYEGIGYKMNATQIAVTYWTFKYNRK